METVLLVDAGIYGGKKRVCHNFRKKRGLASLFGLLLHEIYFMFFFFSNICNQQKERT